MGYMVNKCSSINTNRSDFEELLRCKTMFAKGHGEIFGISFLWAADRKVNEPCQVGIIENNQIEQQPGSLGNNLGKQNLLLESVPIK